MITKESNLRNLEELEQRREEKKQNIIKDFPKLYKGLGDFRRFIGDNHPLRAPFLDSAQDVSSQENGEDGVKQQISIFVDPPKQLPKRMIFKDCKKMLAQNGREECLTRLG